MNSTSTSDSCQTALTKIPAIMGSCCGVEEPSAVAVILHRPDSVFFLRQEDEEEYEERVPARNPIDFGWTFGIDAEVLA